jgi:hypothetical protein
MNEFFRRRWHAVAKLGVVLGFVLSVVMNPVPTHARDEVAAPAMTLGVGDTHRTGAWTPVAVQLQMPAEGTVRIAVEDPDGQFVSSPPVPLTEGGMTAEVCVRPGRPNGQVRVLKAGQGGEAVIASLEAPRAEATPSTTPLVLLVGTLPATESAVRLVAGDTAPMEIVHLDAAPMADLGNPRSFDAFDAVIVCGTALANLDRSTIEGLDGWVRRGGRLVLGAGASAMVLAEAGEPAAGWLPAGTPRLVPLRSVGAIEAFARSGGLASRLPPAGLTVPQFDAAAGMTGMTGMIDVFEGASAADTPLVVRRAHGFGTITWIGLDLDERWCANWPGCDRLLAALLGGRSERDYVLPAGGDAVRRVHDLAGQLRVALDTFAADDNHAATRPVPFEIIMGVGLLYCLALYPLDWWLVRRAGRPWLSWITLPVIAGGFAAAAWGLGAAWGLDCPPRARSADVTDFDSASGLVRGSAWVAVRAPDNGALDVGLAAGQQADVSECDAAVSWFADRGAGFGGLDAAVAHPSLAAASYGYGDSLADMVAVPIAAASSRLFEAGWTGQARGTIAESTLVRDARGLLTGRVTSRLPFAIEGCWLVHGGWLYDVGRMKPGDPYDTEAGRGPRSLAAAVTRRTAVKDRDRTERWDATGTDVGRILEVAGLHAVAGADSYTGLPAGPLGRLDLSPLLAADRAVLVGTIADGPLSPWRVRLHGGGLHGGGDAADLAIETAAASIVRVVVPVRTTTTTTTTATAEETSP